MLCAVVDWCALRSAILQALTHSRFEACVAPLWSATTKTDCKVVDGRSDSRAISPVLQQPSYTSDTSRQNAPALISAALDKGGGMRGRPRR